MKLDGHFWGPRQHYRAGIVVPDRPHTSSICSATVGVCVVVLSVSIAAVLPFHPGPGLDSCVPNSITAKRLAAKNNNIAINTM